MLFLHPCASFSSIVIALCLSLFSPQGVYANPVLATEQSLANGALLYELYCSECHGRESASRDAELDDSANDSALIDIALAEKTPAASEPVKEDDWPEWALPRDPDRQKKPGVEMEVADVVTAAIEKVYADESEQLGATGDLAGKRSGRSFSVPVGLTDLSAPETFFYGTTEDELFKSIASGTGASMPGWRTELGSDEAIWDLVNYIRSFWDEAWLY